MPAGAARAAAPRAAEESGEGKAAGSIRAISFHRRRRSRLKTALPDACEMPDAGELKSVRLIEGSTVKEFAEKLGIKPKDVVTLLLQRGVFATINQP